MPALGLAVGLPFRKWISSGSSFKDFLKSCGGLVTADPAALDPANDGRPLLQRTVRSFDGTTQYATKAVSNYRSGDASGAIEATFSTTATGTNIILNSSNDVASGDNIAVGIRESGKVYIIVKVNGANNGVKTVNSFNDGLTHTARYISNGSTWSIEVNGVLQAIVPTLGSNNGDWFGDVTGKDNLVIGAFSAGGKSAHFNGTISDVKVYDPSGEVVNQWEFVENGGSVMRDALGVHDLTYINNPVVVVANSVGSDPLNERGFSQRMHFDGIDDSVDISPITLAGDFDVTLNLSTDFSASKSFVADRIGAGATRWFFSSSTGNLVFNDTSNASVFIEDAVIVGVQQELLVRVVRISGVITAYINGVSIGSVASTGTYIISTIGGFRGLGGTVDNFAGIISDVDIDGQYIASGHGVDDWGVGTIQGSPANAYLVARLDTPAIDVGGNPTQWANTAYPVEVVKRQSNARAFNGVDQYIYTTNTLTGGSPLNVKGWFSSSPVSGIRTIFSCGGWTSAVSGMILYHKSLSNEIEALITNGSSTITVLFTGSILTASEFNEYEFIWDGGDTLATLILNGVTYTSNSTLGGWVGESELVEVGAYNGGQNGLLSGSMALININDEIIYNLAESTGTTAYDSSGNSNHGTYINNPLNTLQDVRHSNLEEGFSEYMQQGVLLDVNTLVGGDTISYKINTTDSKFIVLEDYLSGGATSYLFSCNIGTQGTSLNSFYCTSIHVDGLDVSSYSADAMSTLLADGTSHDIILSLSSNISNWSQVSIGKYVGYDIIDGGVRDFKINGVPVEPYEVTQSTLVPAINATTDALGNPLTNPATAGVHNGAETQYDFYNVATDGGTTPAIVGSGTMLTDYSFGDSLTNPLFKRELSSVAEDRHTLFSEVLTGACLEKANGFFSLNYITDQAGNIQFDEQGNPQQEI